MILFYQLMKVIFAVIGGPAINTAFRFICELLLVVFSFGLIIFLLMGKTIKQYLKSAGSKGKQVSKGLIGIFIRFYKFILIALLNLFRKIKNFINKKLLNYGFSHKFASLLSFILAWIIFII